MIFLFNIKNNPPPSNNIFDIFPDKQVYSNSYFGVFKYAPVQMGTTGTFYFLKALIRVPHK